MAELRLNSEMNLLSTRYRVRSDCACRFKRQIWMVEVLRETSSDIGRTGLTGHERELLQNQHLILRYLAGLAARQYADTTLSAVVTTLNALIHHLPERRHVVLTDAITQTTAQDISVFITAALSSGLMPSTIKT